MPRYTILLTAIACTSPTTPPTSAIETADTATTPTGDTGSSPCTVSDPSLDIGTVDVELALEGDQVLELCSGGGEWLRLTARAEEWDGPSPTLQLVDPAGAPFGPSIPIEGPSSTNRSQVRYLFAYLPTAGTWTVEATGAAGFTIVREAMPEPTEPDDIASPGLSAADLPTGYGPDGSPPMWGPGYEGFGVVPVALDASDEDWVRIPNVASGGPVEIWGPAGSTASDLGLDVVLYDPDGNEVASADDVGIENRISLWGTVDGDYALKITSSDGSEGWNLLYVRTWPDHFSSLATTETEPNNTQGTANPVDYGTSTGTSLWAHLDGVIGDASDEDWHEVPGGAAGWDLGVSCSDELRGGTATVGIEVVDATGAALPVLDQTPFHAYYDMTGDTAWVRASGVDGRFGDSAYYGCSIRLSDDITIGSSGE